MRSRVTALIGAALLAGACRTATVTEATHQSVQVANDGGAVAFRPDVLTVHRSGDASRAAYHADFGARLRFRGPWGAEDLDIGYRSLTVEATGAGLDLALDGEPVATGVAEAWIDALSLVPIERDELIAHHIAGNVAAGMGAVVYAFAHTQGFWHIMTHLANGY